MESEKRLIDANALLDDVDVSLHDNPHTDAIVRATHKHEHNHFMVMIMQAPTVDAVEVVRCKDCKWFAPNNNGSWIGCTFGTRHPDDAPKPDDFCSYGERKDNE